MRKSIALLLGLSLATLTACGQAPGNSGAASSDAASAVISEATSDAAPATAETPAASSRDTTTEQCNVLDRVQIMPEAVGIEGSSMYLQAGEVLTVQELLYGLMLQSGNDAAVALAIYCGGTVEGFAQLMNDEARRIGLTGTHFENPNGLDHENHYSTARDLAKLTAYAMENEIFAKTVSTKSIQVGGRSLTNHNKLLWRYEGADGVKTGYTKAAGRILVSSATRDGRQLIAVTINAPDDWNDHARLLDYGFGQFETKRLVQAGQCLGTVEVLSGEGGSVDLVAGEDFYYPVARGETLEVQFPGPGFVYAPVTAGQEAGTAHVLLEGVPVGKVPVVWGETIAAPTEPEEPNWLERIWGGKG